MEAKRQPFFAAWAEPVDSHFGYSLLVTCFQPATRRARTAVPPGTGRLPPGVLEILAVMSRLPVPDPVLGQGQVAYHIAKGEVVSAVNGIIYNLVC